MFSVSNIYMIKDIWIPVTQRSWFLNIVHFT